MKIRLLFFTIEVYVYRTDWKFALVSKVNRKLGKNVGKINRIKLVRELSDIVPNGLEDYPKWNDDGFLTLKSSKTLVEELWPEL